MMEPFQFDDRDEIPEDELPDDVEAAFQRWHVPASQGLIGKDEEYRAAFAAGVAWVKAGRPE